ncbi:hypothetical protein KFL_004920020 [Klebsormidium nitens]|uniref:Uncharacterized protein n=1 Tax=Klebsormidium nitens TaxID=105231 RepID=A0A1Y1IGG3_KLENI|nr:hypothetical protein KFL_004920020 [Klebsormidium nitens]|eukprot:GAQ89152.1 hypothetical protein KFL_004920020 [Klebsormidium nitens]
MTSSRRFLTNTLLDNGKVLLAGGLGRAGATTSAELYTPSEIMGIEDPHLEVTLAETQGRPLSFDFHGEAGRTYCMISDSCLQLNVLMFGVPAGSRILKDTRDNSVEPFFDGTWMSGFGILYLDQSGEQKSITIRLDPARAPPARQATKRTSGQVGEKQTNFVIFRIFDVHRGPRDRWHSAQDLESAPSGWIRPDGMATISRLAGRPNALAVSISDILLLEVASDSRKDLIADPPIHYLNFEVKRLATWTDVHGFLGQMFAPGAATERLAMGTLEGLLHREYLESTDDDYLTSDLSTADCAFNRFGEVSDGMMIVEQSATSILKGDS